MGTIDDDLAGLDAADAAAVGHVYAVARDAVDGLEQGTGYGMPALLYRGKPLLSVKRANTHIGVYPFSSAAIDAVRAQVEAHPATSTAKGTIRFQPEHPLPDDLIRTLVLARRAQIDG